MIMPYQHLRKTGELMSTFWKSVLTMQAENGGSYTAFPLFGTVHLGELSVSALLILLVCLWYRKAGARTRRGILVAITALMLADELLKYIIMLATDQWSWAYLPLHLCSINLFVCLYCTLTDKTWCKEELYALCIPGAAIALLCPGWQAVPLWNIMHLHSLSVHVMLLLYPLLLLVGGFRPQARRAPQALAFLFGTAFPIYFLNKALDTNFYFLNEPYSNVITIWFTQLFGEKYYIVGFLPAVLLVMCLMYLPWILARRPVRQK